MVFGEALISEAKSDNPSSGGKTSGSDIDSDTPRERGRISIEVMDEVTCRNSGRLSAFQIALSEIVQRRVDSLGGNMMVVGSWFLGHIGSYIVYISSSRLRSQPLLGLSDRSFLVVRCMRLSAQRSGLTTTIDITD